MSELARLENLLPQIHVVRGIRVIVDVDLARAYGVTTKRLNEGVRRNSSRFPSDFVFQITESEHETLRSQFATSKLVGRTSEPRGGRRYLPWVFTEHGVIQAANILNSARAIGMGVFIVRVFVKMRELVGSNTELARRLDELESRVDWALMTIQSPASSPPFED